MSGIHPIGNTTPKTNPKPQNKGSGNSGYSRGLNNGGRLKNPSQNNSPRYNVPRNDPPRNNPPGGRYPNKGLNAGNKYNHPNGKGGLPHHKSNHDGHNHNHAPGRVDFNTSGHERHGHHHKPSNTDFGSRHLQLDKMAKVYGLPEHSSESEVIHKKALLSRARQEHGLDLSNNASEQDILRHMQHKSHEQSMVANFEQLNDTGKKQDIKEMEGLYSQLSYAGHQSESVKQKFSGILERAKATP